MIANLRLVHLGSKGHPLTRLIRCFHCDKMSIWCLTVQKATNWDKILQLGKLIIGKSWNRPPSTAFMTAWWHIQASSKSHCHNVMTLSMIHLLHLKTVCCLTIGWIIQSQPSILVKDRTGLNIVYYLYINYINNYGTNLTENVNNSILRHLVLKSLFKREGTQNWGFSLWSAGKASLFMLE